MNAFVPAVLAQLDSFAQLKTHSEIDREPNSHSLPMRLLLSLLAVAHASAAGTLAVTFKDCGVNAYAKVLTVAPNSLPLGKTTTISGTGQVL